MKLPIRITNTKLHTRILLAILALIIVSAFVMIIRQHQGTTINQNWEHTKITFIGTTWDASVTLDVDIADTPNKQEYGLMFRWQMNWGFGMLFVFEDEQIRYFWMKNTYIPLDMIFVNSTWTIVSIRVGAESMNETPVSSIFPAKYVIETNSWWTMKAWLQPGMKVDLSKIK